MIFNSIDFAVFFSVFFILYWFVLSKRLITQNLLLLIGSYFFYAYWDWRFLSLLIGSTWLTYYLGLKLSQPSNERTKKIYFYIGIFQGIGMLIYFKYFDFFITSFLDLINKFGLTANYHSLKLILPLGISFYTFRTLSYLLDIEKGKIEASKNWLSFFTYVAFFPSLISGPIDRAKPLLIQIEKDRLFDYSQITDGCRQVLWGLFKKIVIADNCAVVANNIFKNYESLPASELILGAFYYTIQIYADFSGYSDMAVGFSRMIGFNITKNFDYPFFAQNIADYWRRWHMSLTSWLTEYVFTPLSIAFRDWGNWGLIIAIIINFVVCGIWHGANWTYVLFGFLHGCYFIPLILNGSMNKKNKSSREVLFPTIIEVKNIVLTFFLVLFTNIVFRSNSFPETLGYFKRLISISLFTLPPSLFNETLIWVGILFGIEWINRSKEFGLQINEIQNKLYRWVIYIVLVLSILIKNTDEQVFIYFQF